MATEKQKEEILFLTKQANSLRVKRNGYAAGSKNKTALQKIIDNTDAMIKEKKKQYGL
jgi:hypothetical protein